MAAKATLLAFSGPDVFNAIRNSSPTLQLRYSKATAENIESISKNISQSDMTIKNELTYGLMKLVTAVFTKDTSIRNPLANMVKGGLFPEFGAFVEQNRVHVIKGISPKFGGEFAISGTSIDPFVQDYTKVESEFFETNLKLTYLVTTNTWDLSKAFLSAAGMNSLLGQIMKGIENALNIDLFMAGKDIFNTYISTTNHTLGKGQVMEVTAVTDETSGKNFVLSMKNLLNAIQFPSTAFNPRKLEMQTDALHMYIRPEVMNTLSTEVWASAFNRSDLGLTPQDGGATLSITSIDNFGGIIPTLTATGETLVSVYDSVLGKQIGFATAAAPTVVIDESLITFVDSNSDVLAIVATDSAFGIALRMMESAPAYNARGSYTNYWYNAEYWTYYSDLEPVIIIKKKA